MCSCHNVCYCKSIRNHHFVETNKGSVCMTLEVMVHGEFAIRFNIALKYHFIFDLYEVIGDVCY